MSGRFRGGSDEKLHAIVADIRGESGRFADRVDVEYLLRALGFTCIEIDGVRIYRHDAGVTAYVHMDSAHFPAGVARDLLQRINANGLL